eukprot:TRINITY_DN1408_c0_g1_i1.p1 TRINITY_DN1408_c0_g1~~TRINITY_DN1408_c0_g1_i1.p1  ORF type:complete len:315 (-),score=70.33 TRINITY_DN1408_c0_g1_i1:28-972(-)
MVSSQHLSLLRWVAVVVVMIVLEGSGVTCQKPADPAFYYTSTLTTDGNWRVNGNWDRPGFPVTRNTSAILPRTTNKATVIIENGTSNVVFQTVVGPNRRVRVGPSSHLTIIPFSNGGSCGAGVEVCQSTIGKPITISVTDPLNFSNRTYVTVKNLETGKSLNVELTTSGEGGTFYGSVLTSTRDSAACLAGNDTILCINFGDLLNVTYAANCVPALNVTIAGYLDCSRYQNVTAPDIQHILFLKSVEDNIKLLEEIQYKADFLLNNLPKNFDLVRQIDFSALAELVLQASTTCLNDYCLNVNELLAALTAVYGA